MAAATYNKISRDEAEILRLFSQLSAEGRRAALEEASAMLGRRRA
jgi:hypothetical protein